jgi:hypothetical protein
MHKGSQRAQRITQYHKAIPNCIQPFHSQTIPSILGRTQTACNRKLGYHDCCTRCKGQCPVPTISDFITRRWQEKPPFYHSYTSFGVWLRDHYMPLQRPTIGVCWDLLWIPQQRPHLQCYGFPSKVPSYTMRSGIFTKYVTTYDTKSDANPHSTEQDTQPIAFLISRQIVPYQTCGGTCCPVVSTPKIWSLPDLSTTYHDGINHLHHSNH